MLLDFEWNTLYQIGVETIDNEHRLFLSLIKKYQLSVDEIQEIQTFDELIRYIRFHFASEENLMSIHGYSRINEHKQAHLKLLDRITEFQTGIEMGLNIKEDLLEFLLDWFESHTTKMDKDFSDEINSEKS